MKIVERFVISIMAMAFLYAIHQILDSLFRTHGWEGLDASAWASWVQALGSIAALLVAVLVMKKQNDNALDLMAREHRHAAGLVVDADRRSTLRKVDSVHAILGRYRNQLVTIASSMHWQAVEHREIVSVARQTHIAFALTKKMKETLQTIPVFEIGSFDLADAVLRFIEVVDMYIDRLSSLCLSVTPRPTQQDSQVFLRFADFAHDTLIAYEEAARDLRK